MISLKPKHVCSPKEYQHFKQFSRNGKRMFALQILSSTTISDIMNFANIPWSVGMTDTAPFSFLEGSIYIQDSDSEDGFYVANKGDWIVKLPGRKFGVLTDEDMKKDYMSGNH